MSNYFNTLSLHGKLDQLGKCRSMSRDEFKDGCNFLRGKKIVIVGCGAQGLNQGLNMRDSGLDVSYALREGSIKAQHKSWHNAVDNGFKVGTYEEMIPTADLVINLTPDKQHSSVVNAVMPLMKPHSALGYSHGFNIVEVGQQIRKDITVVMSAPKCPGTEVRNEFKRGFGVPTLIAVHPENDPDGNGWAIAKAWCSASTAGEKAGVLSSSFVAEVKSDLMGEQTILCGMLQTASICCYDRMMELGIDSGYAVRLLQYGFEVVGEALKFGGVTNMMDRLSNPAKLRAFELAEELKQIMRPLYQKHMDNIMSGEFSSTMMKDWAAGDPDLLKWRKETGETAFEKAACSEQHIPEQEFFDHGILIVAMIKAGVELAFECMTGSGIKPESAYYESLHEVPLIANTIARKKLAEYGNYLFANACIPMLKADFMKKITTEEIGGGLKNPDTEVDNATLVEVNEKIRNHPIEVVGRKLRAYMTDMKRINFGE